MMDLELRDWLEEHLRQKQPYTWVYFDFNTITNEKTFIVHTIGEMRRVLTMADVKKLAGES